MYFLFVFFVVVAGGGLGILDFEESVRSSKVLQGQENVTYISPPYGCDKVNSMLDNVPGASGQQSLSSSRIPRINMSEFRSLAQPVNYTGFLESNRFPKVLQGQEICPLRSFTGKMNFNPGAWLNPTLASTYFNGPKPSFYPLASEGTRNMYFPFDVYKSDLDSVTIPCENTMEKENSAFGSSSFRTNVLSQKFMTPNVDNEHTSAKNLSLLNSLNASDKDQKDGLDDGPRPNCKLFGFSLEQETSGTNSEIRSRRSCTKVRFLCHICHFEITVKNCYSLKL